VSPLLPIVLPLLAAVLYVAGVLLVKRAAEGGAGLWRMTSLSNLVSAALFTLLLPLGGTFHAELLWQPALVAVLFLAGQGLNFLALQRGDVSVATPVLGLKIILVAGFTTLLLATRVSLRLWAAAGLTSLALALLNRTDGGPRHRVGATVLYAAGSAAMFAVFDVLVQRWSPAWGAGRFLPVMLGFVALLTLALETLFRTPGRAMPRAAWSWLLAGAVLLGLQSMLFVGTIARFGEATSANVVYSSRGLWSVVAVWAVGPWFGNRERHLGGRVLGRRLAGAVLMMAAIALALVK
jgi:drug/metabolite transporter (DMT)-like permease